MSIYFMAYFFQKLPKLTEEYYKSSTRVEQRIVMIHINNAVAVSLKEKGSMGETEISRAF